MSTVLYNSLSQGFSVFAEIHPTPLINLFSNIKKNGGVMNVRQQLFLPV
ncbi:MAG: hypothetical protein IH618_17145 [Ignavibacteriaceae bacterium]|nr:hypothetical protein [Ignavibacteriaceae bacterium]